MLKTIKLKENSRENEFELYLLVYDIREPLSYRGRLQAAWEVEVLREYLCRRILEMDINYKN